MPLFVILLTLSAKKCEAFLSASQQASDNCVCNDCDPNSFADFSIIVWPRSKSGICVFQPLRSEYSAVKCWLHSTLTSDIESSY